MTAHNTAAIISITAITPAIPPAILPVDKDPLCQAVSHETTRFSTCHLPLYLQYYFLFRQCPYSKDS